MEKGIILIHPSIMGVAFDVFVNEKYVNEEWVQKIKSWLYECPECPFVKDYQEEQSNFVYLGSEDFCHTKEINAEIFRVAKKIVDSGFKVVFQPPEDEGGETK